jgi:uncharacterized protein YkwD
MKTLVRVLILLPLLCATPLGAAGAVPGPSAAALPAFCDVDRGNPAWVAVTTLAAIEIVRGYENGCFGPNDHVLRAQMAALIARAMVWDGEDRGNPFPDRNGVDDALWRNVGTLAARGVAKGYQDGTFNPTGPVLHAQVISFIARGMVAKGRWQAQPDDPSLYPQVPASSGHRADIATYVAYAGALPDRPTSGPLNDWNGPATRAWFARALWQALNWNPAPGLDAEESSFLTIINLYRERRGLAPLVLSGTLTAAAKWMSADLVTRVVRPEDFSHGDSLGRDPFVRMCAFGYCFNTWRGENIAAGNPDAVSTFVQWRDSPGHNANMLRPEYVVIGIGRAQGGLYRWYWTTNFGGQ